MLEPTLQIVKEVGGCGFSLLKGIEKSLLKHPRPSYIYPAKCNPWVKSTIPAPPLTRESFERYLCHQVDSPSPEDIIRSSEWYWTVRQEKIDSGQDVT
jgi:hypothetical protein